MRPVLFATLLLVVAHAHADDKAIDLGEVGATGTDTAKRPEKTTAEPPKKAAAIAVTQSSLTAKQPQTVLNSHFIKQMAAPASDYLAIAQFAPSVSSSSPNGQGLSSKNAAIRGFQDGQYNVTFDGIPFSDPSSFAHATTSFFPATVLDHVVVDRGPGTASTVGNATFGGTVSLFSATPSQKAGGEVTGGFGSGKQRDENAILDTGAIAKTGGTTAELNVDHRSSDGLLQDAGFRRNNVAVKVQQPIAGNTVVTLFASYDDLTWNGFSQSNLTHTAQYGRDYANLNNDPNSQSYAPYNYDHRKSDFEYIGLQSDFGIIRIDNKAYTYSLNDQSQGGADTTGATPNSSLLASGVPGATVDGMYRSFGDIFKVEGDVGRGIFATTVRAGVWLEHSRYANFEQSLNLTTGQVAAFIPYAKNGSVINNNIAVTNEAQSFFEFDWKPIRGLSITPGFKHIDFERSFNGTDSFAKYDDSARYRANLGTLSANYRIAEPLSVYAQWAMGFQAPPVSVQKTSSSSANRLTPQQTLNYQSGVVYKSDRITADFDAYYINFHNMINSDLETVNGLANQTVYFNQGGVIYKGLEAEGTVVLGQGFALTANGSLNNAKSKTTGLWIANAPSSTAMLGVLYERGSFFGSLLTKYVGSRYAGAGESRTARNRELPAYRFTDLTLGIKLDKRAKLQLLIDNLFNSRTATEGNGGATNPTYYYLPERNYMLQATVYF